MSGSVDEWVLQGSKRRRRRSCGLEDGSPGEEVHENEHGQLEGRMNE